MHNFSCPVIARYVRFIPTAFISYIGLAVDIYGCDDVIQVNGLYPESYLFRVNRLGEYSMFNIV